jgi:hypothetical protein
MSRGTTIADFVQQVLYAVYKVRLDVTYSDPNTNNTFHADTDKFKEIIMEANFVLQEIQQAMDWNWLRARVTLGEAEILPHGGIQEFCLPENVYKVCTGFNDAVRLHHPRNPNSFIEIPYTSPRNGTVNNTAMFDTNGRMNVADNRIMAFVVGNHLTFTRPFLPGEAGMIIETDVVELLEPLHICTSSCTQPCPSVYVDKVFTRISDPYYMVVRTAVKRAGADPSATDQVLPLSDEAMKLLSAMRENDSAKTVPDTYSSIELGFTRIL